MLIIYEFFITEQLNFKINVLLKMTDSEEKAIFVHHAIIYKTCLTSKH